MVIKEVQNKKLLKQYRNYHVRKNRHTMWLFVFIYPLCMQRDFMMTLFKIVCPLQKKDVF